MAVAMPSPQLPPYVPKRHVSGSHPVDSAGDLRRPWTTTALSGLPRSGSTEVIPRPFSFGNGGLGPLKADVAEDAQKWAYPSTYPNVATASNGMPKVLESEDRSMVFASLMMAAEDMKLEHRPSREAAVSSTSTSQAIEIGQRLYAGITAPFSNHSLEETPKVQDDSKGKVVSQVPHVDKPAVARLCLPKIIPASIEKQALLERIMALLKDPSKLAILVRQHFRMVDVTGQGIDVAAFVKFRHHLAFALDVPEINECDASRQHLRFDLHGQGKLQEPDAYLLVKSYLREYCKTLGECIPGITVVEMSPAESGFQIGEDVLGTGNQSIARRAIDREGRACCVKIYEKAKMNAVDVDALKTEFEVLQRLGTHSSIARAFEIFEDSQYYYMTFELYQGGDFTTLKEAAALANVVVDDAWWRGVFRQCFEGLGYLHGNAFMHCDIKESNVMLKRDVYDSPEVVIIDFGFVQGFILDSTTISGTPGYIPPETWGSGRFFPRGDVFAMGVVIMQMLLDKVPPHHNPPECEVLPGGIFTDGVSLIKAVGTVTRTRTPPFNLMAKQWPVLTQLTRRLLAKDVLKRPSVRQVLQDVWFASDSQDVILPRYL